MESIFNHKVGWKAVNPCFGKKCYLWFAHGGSWVDVHGLCPIIEKSSRDQNQVLSLKISFCFSGA